jgi:hypothetical protein
MELIQRQVHYTQEGKHTFDQFYLDEDYNVPDTKEDVRQIIQAKGTVKVEDMNLADNYLRVSGKLYFQILYMTDSEETRPAALDGKIPFEEMVYIDTAEPVTCFIENVRVEFSASLVHSRKIGLRAMIELEIGRQQLRDEETTTDIESEIPVFKKMRRLNLLELHTSKKDTYRIKEEITLPGTKESIGQILLCDITGRRLEIRPAQDRLLLQGELLVFLMYLSEDGRTDWLEQSVPYEGQVECEGVEEGMYFHVQHTLEDTLADIRMDEDGEMRVAGIEGTLNLRMNIYREEEIELLEDLYSLEQNCMFDTREAVYEELMIQNHSKCKIAERLSLPELKGDALQICHSDGMIQIMHMEQEENGIQIEGILHLSFLYLRGNDELPFGSWQGMVPFTWLLECPEMKEETRSNISYHVEQLSVSFAGNEDVEVKAVLSFDTFIRRPAPVQVVTGVEFTPLSADEMEKRPGIVGYVVKKGDQLWNLAKRFMTTEEGIMEVNGLESPNIKEGDKLLIFKENMSIL